MSEEDPGYLEARRDRFGPFIKVRWWHMEMVVRENAWLTFVDEVKRGHYLPTPLEKVNGKRGWVRFAIDEGFAERERPVAWRPKVLDVPRMVWDRFVDAVGRLDLANVGPCWTGGPLREPPEARIPAVQGEVLDICVRG
ncbi:hypothetical protein [Nonomuraea turcica]|uniref:hypothetical protein n=1 Tax=Nonomuraea sp. G32 TaxID=3067274 RepID=UPI00273A7BFD|nr:hypothetical protein [Nonomuraea sp. G32]MDP4511576.1 hypothetical protein [Nonomuraea sp. G32]